MTFDEMFPSKYLAKSDFPYPKVFTISDVIEVILKSDEGNEKKAAMTFHGQEKGMIVNKGNGMACVELFGGNTDAWRGKRIEVYVDPAIMFGGKRVGGLRLRAPSSNSNSNTGNGEAWTVQEALAKAAAAGITRYEVLANVNGRGFAGWNAARDTAFVQAMIERKNEVPFGEDEPFDGGAPFSDKALAPVQDESAPF